ncbi:TetR/AcrR family transcriptional regulator [Frankia sp. AgKG'84/4]|uniref:TetR/AcrR family transcriptional regulator n=1 Tax=Frankia sp. AgKG'84/4 TaxID=573490 RepID=UPI00200C93EA|nr:TetR/AcrR family transcriptional regulator [Frankia sp. AgKG'84/4]MCL9794367.1 TetR/AcrR family transcriptional regulator [Frankia sp. AgKG'84/4]
MDRAHEMAGSGVAAAAGSGRAAGPSGGPGAASLRGKIVDATVTCIRRRGIERTSISAIAATAGVSRPTVYAHFETRDALVSAALTAVGVQVSQTVVGAARRRARTAGEFVVEALVAVRREFRAEPALRPLLGGGHWDTHDALSARALAVARPIIAPVVDYDTALEPFLDELVETAVRWLHSLLMFDSARTSSEARLRAYLRRAVVPVIDAMSASAAGTDQPGGG